MKKYNVVGIGNSMLDLVYHCDEGVLSSCQLQKGSSLMTDESGFAAIEKALAGRAPKLAAGGSVMNSMALVAQLGGRAALCTTRGNDAFGEHFAADAQNIGVELSAVVCDSVRNGFVISLVTPDGERTMRFSVGANAAFDGSAVRNDLLEQTEWLFIEGYQMANNQSAGGVVVDCAQRARARGAQVAFTCSDPFVVNVFRAQVEALLPHLDLLFANIDEALALTGASSAEAAFESLCGRVRNVVVTMSEGGAFVCCNGWRGHVPTVPVKPVDATGAGDAFAGGFLYGISGGKVSPEQSAIGAHRLATKVISQDGARLAGDVRAVWLGK